MAALPTTKLSSIEDALTKYIRHHLSTNYHPATLKAAAFCSSLLVCLVGASVLLISLFTPSYQKKLGYSSFEINVISSAANLGGYFAPPVMGFLGDYHGPVLLSAVSLVTYVTGYSTAAYSYQQNLSYLYPTAAFFMIGIGTSSLFFSALMTTTKIFPHYKGIAISGPSTCYGLSSILGAQLLKLQYFQDDNFLDLYVVFRFFAIFYGTVSILSWITSCVVSIEKDVVYDETAPLLQESGAENDSYSAKFSYFVSDHTAYFFLLCMLLVVGPQEMYITNMGSVVGSIGPYGPSPNTQVSVFSVFSTMARLLVGASIDIISRRGFAKSWVLSLLITMMIVPHALVASTWALRNYQYFEIISGLNGLVYGGLFTIFPAIVMAVWGEEIFGTAYGCFMVAPAIGATVFGILYGFNYDKNCSIILGETPLCTAPTFAVTTVCTVVGLLLSTSVYLFSWRRRSISL